MKKITLIIVVCIFLASPVFAARSITLPFTLSMDTDDYSSDLIWLTNGATHTHLSSGCWSGGCAKFTPPNVCTIGGVLGFGAFNGLNHGQINIRFLMKVGPTYYSTAANCGEGYGNKLVDALQIDEGGRSLVGLLQDGYVPPGTSPEPYGICTSGPSGTDYNCHNGGGGIAPCNKWYPSMAYATDGCGYDTFHFGKNITTDYDNQWVSIEVELIKNGYNKIYIHTLDGVHNGLYVTNDALSNNINWSYIRHIGGYSNQSHPTADADTYIIFDELKISTSYIGPPDGFLDSVRTAAGVTSMSGASFH